MADPGQIEVLAWMSRTGAGAAEAVDHFWPGADPEARKKLSTKVRLWKHRSAEPQSSRNAATGDDERPSEGPTRIVVDERHEEPGRLDRVPFLERQLARLEAVMEAVMESGNVGRVAQVDSRISEVRQQLDIARIDAGKTVKLDRNPGAVAEASEKRRKALEILANAHKARAKNL